MNKAARQAVKTEVDRQMKEILSDPTLKVLKILSSDGTSIHPHTMDGATEIRALALLTYAERKTLESEGAVYVYRDGRWVFSLYYK